VLSSLIIILIRDMKVKRKIRDEKNDPIVRLIVPLSEYVATWLRKFTRWLRTGSVELPTADGSVASSPRRNIACWSWSNAKGVMDWLKVMWGRKKSGIDMVMVNESRERERERESERSGKRRGVPEICGWFFDVARRGFGVRKSPLRGVIMIGQKIPPPLPPVLFTNRLHV